MKNEILNFIFDNWLLIGPLVYEIISRVWPTKWNISLFDNIWKIINLLIPNKRISDGKESGLATNARGEIINSINVNMGKHILKALLLVCLFSVGCSAQKWQNFKGIRLVNVLDSTSVYPVNGSIFYNEQKTYPRFQVWENDTLKNLISEGGGETITASNGLTKTGSDITLEGDLTKSTRLYTAANSFQVRTDAAFSAGDFLFFAGFSPVQNRNVVTSTVLNDLSRLVNFNITKDSAYVEYPYTASAWNRINVDVNSVDLRGNNITLSSPTYIGSSNINSVGNLVFSRTSGTGVITQTGNSTTLNIVGSTGTGATNGGNVQLVSGTASGNAGHISLTGSLSTGAGSDGNINIHLGTLSTGTITIDEQAGHLILPSLPTATPCGTAPAGTIWNNGGVLNICP